MADDDIVTDLLLRFRAAFSAATSTGMNDFDLLRLQLEARQAWGGMRPYVRKWAPDDVRARVVGVTLSTGGSLQDAFDAADVGKTKGHALLSRRWPR